MKKIVIIAAMDEELEAIQNKFENVEEKKLKDLVYYEGQAKGKEYVLTKCGVGKVNAARTTQILTDKFNVKSIINVGSAGALKKEINYGDIVIGEKLVQYDFDITAFNHPKGYIPKVGVYVECDRYLRELAFNIKKDNVYDGTIATGDMFCTDIELSKKIKEEFNAVAVEMEGASIGMTSYLSGIPFLVIRSISDVIGKDNLITYDKFLKKSSTEVAEFTLEIINNL